MVQPEQPQPVTPVMQPLNPNFIKGRPVVSIDEARAAQIDLDGSLYVFPDLGNKRIYTKKINMDGTAAFDVFELAPQAPQAALTQPVYVTREELDEVIAELRASLTPIEEPQPRSARSQYDI